MTLALFAAAVVLLGVAARLMWLWVKPYKACGVCSGRGHCVRCRYTGKVLKLGAAIVHPELKRKAR